MRTRRLSREESRRDPQNWKGWGGCNLDTKPACSSHLVWGFSFWSTMEIEVTFRTSDFLLLFFSSSFYHLLPSLIFHCGEQDNLDQRVDQPEKLEESDGKGNCCQQKSGEVCRHQFICHCSFQNHSHLQRCSSIAIHLFKEFPIHYLTNWHVLALIHMQLAWCEADTCLVKRPHCQFNVTSLCVKRAPLKVEVSLLVN